jgi:hypothetical protein
MEAMNQWGLPWHELTDIELVKDWWKKRNRFTLKSNQRSS